MNTPKASATEIQPAESHRASRNGILLAPR
jgi:hypothetical protein